MLVVDDAQWLIGEPLDSLIMLAREIRRESQLVLCGRTDIKRILGRGRAQGEVLEVGTSELAFDDAEAHELFERAGLDLPDHVVQEVNSRVEGWAAGLYLCALVTRESGALPSLEAASIDRFLADYFESEHLAGIPESRLDFLLGSAVLTRMCAELCDAVLERRDSRRLLEEIGSSNLLLVPLDRARVWFRYHDLFRAALLQRLEAADPRARDRLCVRAAEWCESNGLSEEAVRYALAAGDHDRAARLIITIAPPLYRLGRASTLGEWFARFDHPALISRYPEVSSLAAYLHLLSGRAFQAERWADAAARGLGDDDPLPDGSPSARPWVATVEALLCRHGPAQMRRDATAALAELGPSSPLRGTAEWLYATSYLLEGASMEAERRLADAAKVALAMGNQFVGFNAQAQRSLILLERGDEASARSVFELAKPPMFEKEAYRNYIDFALISAAAARLALRAGDIKGALATLAVCQRLRPLLTHAMPWYSVHTLIEMAKSYRELEDFNATRALLRDAAEILRHRPDLGVLGRQVERLRALSAPEHDNGSGWEWSLTKAELRLLPLLMTHLTLREISERLDVSPNTVKTQTTSIYRKLDVSSRSQAVRRAADLGLLDAVPA